MAGTIPDNDTSRFLDTVEHAIDLIVQSKSLIDYSTYPNINQDIKRMLDEASCILQNAAESPISKPYTAI